MIFGTWGLIAYLAQFFLIIISINDYSDGERHLSCKAEWPKGDIRNSEVYDMALVLMASYHLIEWVRIIMFLITVVLGQNLIPIYYVTGLNTLFGIAAYIYVHATRFSDVGKYCADIQVTRGAFLLAEVIVFWTTFHILSFPNFFLFIMKKDNLESALKKSDSDDEGSDKD